jgi:DNA-directed RNA polymerase specialized sigma24 family protein
MGVRKGTKVHPASFDLVLTLKDKVGFTYEELADILGVTPSRVQQIVLHQRKNKGWEEDADVSSGYDTDEARRSVTA